MQVPSAAVTTESHALSRYKSFQSVLFFEYLINQLLPQRVFQQHRTFVQVGLAGPNTSILALQNPIAIAFSLAIGFRNNALPYDF
jgi:hypothetical protein